MKTKPLNPSKANPEKATRSLNSRRLHTRLHPVPRLFFPLSMVAVLTTWVDGATLRWDANLSLYGVQDGNGTWSVGGAGWYGLSGNTVWDNTNVAAFGIDTTTNCTIALATDVSPVGITFIATGGGSYTIAGDKSINLSNTPIITADASAEISAAVTGGGGFLKLGLGTLTLSNTNTYEGATEVLQGTLKLGSPWALGGVALGTDIANGTTLDVNGQDLSRTDETITVSGTGLATNGAILNTSPTAGWLKSVTLVGDTTINAENPVSVGSTTGQDGTFNLNGFTLTKTGAGRFVINGTKMTGAGDITVNKGTLSVTAGYQNGQRATALTGTGTLTINSGATLQMNPWNTSVTMTMPIVLNGGTVLLNWPTELLVVASPITLTANSTFNLTDGRNRFPTFSGAISGSYGLTKKGVNLLRLSGTNTYTGPTVVSAGTLQVNGVLGNTAVTVAGGAELGGTGVINGRTIVQSGGMLSPGSRATGKGDAIGALSISNTLDLSGTVFMEISKSDTNFVSDQIIGISTLYYGGSLIVTNTGSAALTAGDKVTLFSASNYARAFSTLTLPALGTGLGWDTGKLGVDGSLTVIAVTAPQITGFSKVSEGVFQFTLTNFFATKYTVLVSTNLSSWAVLESGVDLLGGTNYITDPAAKNSVQQFYRLRFP